MDFWLGLLANFHSEVPYTHGLLAIQALGAAMPQSSHQINESPLLRTLHHKGKPSVNSEQTRSW